MHGFVVENQVDPQQEKNETMSHITEHYSKEKREGDCCKDRGIDFLIAGNSVSVGNLLSNYGIGICVEGSGRLCDFQLL